jgi:hypothetical protein
MKAALSLSTLVADELMRIDPLAVLDAIKPDQPNAWLPNRPLRR